MDWLEALRDMVIAIGVPGVVIVLWAILPLIMTVLLISIITIGSKQSKRNNEAFTKQIESLTSAIIILTDKVSSPYLDTRCSLIIYKSIMKEHVSLKIKLLEEILEKNSIQTRRLQIEDNIEREFKRITAEESDKLSNFKSVCGDMGKTIQEEVQWKPLFSSLNGIFFSNDKPHLKIIDIKTLLNEEVDRIAHIIEDNGVHN